MMIDRERGFTLVELLVVVAVIAVLVGLITPTLVMAKHLANEKVCASNLRSISIGLVMYLQNQGSRYPLEPTEHNPHPDLLRLLVGKKCATNDLFYCPQAAFLEKSTQDASYAPVGATDSVINTPANLAAGNISYVYWSFTDNKRFGAQTWREWAEFVPRQLTADGAIAMDSTRALKTAPPQERWVMSDFFRKGAPFPHARSHASGLDVVFQDGHADLIFGSPKNAYR